MAALGVRPPEWNDNYKAKIKKIFDRCDDDKSGTVSLDELGRALAAEKDLCRILGIDPIAAEPGNKAKLREVFDVVDVDGSDELDFDEFGLFFQSRVEILRYLPGTDDEDKFCIIQESIEQIRDHANEIHPMAIPGLFNDRIADIKPVVEGLADAIVDDIPSQGYASTTMSMRPMTTSSPSFAQCPHCRRCGPMSTSSSPAQAQH